MHKSSQKMLLDFRCLLPPPPLIPLLTSVRPNAQYPGHWHGLSPFLPLSPWHQCHPPPPLPRPATSCFLAFPSLHLLLSSFLGKCHFRLRERGRGGPLSQSVFILPRGAIPVKPDDYLARFLSPVRGSSFNRTSIKPDLLGKLEIVREQGSAIIRNMG